MDYLKNFLNVFKDYLKKFNLTQILMIVFIFVVSLVGILMLGGVFKSVTYSVLYSDMAVEEAGSVTAKLTDMGIDYKLSDGGRTIKVPSGKVYEARISLASMGLPSGGSVGYSIFDKTNLGMTEFVQKVNYRRALEGELSRTISNLEEVRAARVHIVVPEKRLFEEDQKEATASVVLKLVGAGALNNRQLFGIKHLVASSVEGLNADNITIVDNWGNLLTSVKESDPMISLSATQLEMKKSVESYLENKAQSLLSSALGNSRAIVRIDADLDFDQVTKTSEIYDPDRTAIRSEERKEYSASDSSVGYDTTVAQGRESDERVVTNYEISKTVESIVPSVGGIKKLSVAVMVDGTYEEVENEEGNLEQQYLPRSEEELQQLSAIVKRAVGFNQDRNDEFDIVNMAFDTQQFEVEQQELEKVNRYNFIYNIGKKVLLVAAILIGFLYLKKKVVKLFKALAKYAPPPPPPSPKPVQEPEVDIEPPKPKLVDKMRGMAKEQPKEVSKVIKTIMAE